MRRKEDQSGLRLPSYAHVLRAFTPLGCFRTSAPSCHHKGAVNKTLRQIELAALFEVLGQSLENPLQRAIAHPALEAAMAGLVQRIPVRQISPLGSRPQDPQNPVEYLPAAAPRVSVPVLPPRQFPDEGFKHPPLLVRQVHRCILLDSRTQHITHS